MFTKRKAREGTPITPPDMRNVWRVCIPAGVALWLIAVILWLQNGMDQAALFHYDAARVALTPFVAVNKWLTSNGMAVIAGILVLYLLLSRWIKALDAPLTVYLYTICSFALSGIAGDLLKFAFARPRPLAIFGDTLTILSDSLTYAIPSGHATKSVALVLPFLVLVSSSSSTHKAFKVLLALIAGGVCFSRIVLGAHYVSDVLAGTGTALIGLSFTMLFANMILKKMTEEMLPKVVIVWGALLVFLIYVFMII